MAGAPAGFDLVAIAASAGGLKAISEVLGALPADFPAAVIVLQHLDRRHRSLMVEILARRTPLPVSQAIAGERIAPGRVYVAPPDHHLLIEPDRTVLLTQTELVHFVRPSADLLFESVAATFRERAIAVVLSGSGQDGAMGVKAIKKTGGTLIVQEPRSAEFRGMPDAAEAGGHADFVLPVAEIAPALVALVCPHGAP